jgi:hypothetical protein
VRVSCRGLTPLAYRLDLAAQGVAAGCGPLLEVALARVVAAVVADQRAEETGEADSGADLAAEPRVVRSLDAEDEASDGDPEAAAIAGRRSTIVVASCHGRPRRAHVR